jgi:cytochrome c oxidase subunit II
MFPGMAMSGSARDRARRVLRALGVPALAAAAASCRGDVEYVQTTFHPASEFGDQLNAVFYNTFWWTMAILLIVFVLLTYAVVRFREQPGAPRPRPVHGNTTLEIVWTVIPAIIVVFLAVPTVRTLFATQRMPEHVDLLVEVVGHQWWWEFRYPDHDVVTANQFVIPANRKVHLRMHSADVLHSFWIPRFGGKRDVNPLERRPEGQESHNINHLFFTIREPGLYYGQCAEFCGASHAIMLMNAQVVSDEEFEQWLASMRAQEPLEPVPPGVAPAEPGAVPPEPDVAAAEPAPEADAPAAPQPAAQPQPVRPAMPLPIGIGQRVTAPPSHAELVAQGEEIFMRSLCVACHAVAGTSARGQLGPNLTRYATRPTVGAGAARNTQENNEAWIRNPHSMKPGVLMPGTRTGGGGMPATDLTDEEVRAVAAYLMSLR